MNKNKLALAIVLLTLVVAFFAFDLGRFFSIEYLKKARGTIFGECRCEPIQNSERREYELAVQLSDESGTLVAQARMPDEGKPKGRKTHRR